jgi:hypothetical protein
VSIAIVRYIDVSQRSIDFMIIRPELEDKSLINSIYSGMMDDGWRVNAM